MRAKRGYASNADRPSPPAPLPEVEGRWSRSTRPVWESSIAASCSGVPAATIRPPAWPPSGPRSMIQSAVLITSRLCSTTSTVLPAVDEAVQHLEQHLDVGEVQAGGRFVQQVERPAGALLDQLAGELDALGLAAGEGGRRLAELHVIQPHVVQRLQLLGDRRDVLEVRQGLLNVHFEHFGDRLALVADLEGLAVEAMALADRAGDPDVGEEVHFELVGAVAFAGLAAAAGDVEAEAAGLVAAGLGLGQLREELADLVEDLDVGGRVGARRAADGRLVDGDQACRGSPGPRCGRGRRGCPGRRSGRAASASTRMSLTSELLPEPETPVTHTNRPRGISTSMFLRLLCRAPRTTRDLPLRGPAGGGDGDPPRAGEVLAGDAPGLGDHRGQRSGGDDLAAAHAGTGTEIDEVIGRPHRVLVVLDHDDGVALVAEPGEASQELPLSRGCRPMDGSSRM